ncbi:MAG: hypothetical protein RSD57_17350 [Comamonas sp.]
MKHTLTPLAQILSRHREDLEDDELEVGETPAETLKRLGLKRPDELPEFRSMPALPTSASADEIQKAIARLIRQYLLPKFLGGGFTNIEIEAMLDDEDSPIERDQAKTQVEMSKLQTRLTQFADKWDPLAADDSAYVEQLERIRAEFEAPAPRKGVRP